MGRRHDTDGKGRVVRDREVNGPPVVVEFRRAPAELLQEARMHLEAITREFQLIEFSDEEVESPPARLLDVISRLQANYDRLGFAGDRRFALEAIERGESTVDFELPVPAEAGGAARLLITLMEETDAWCERGELLTLASPPEQRRMRRWFFGEIERQTAGGAPVPWDDFDEPSRIDPI
jgi:hypothetical protein